MPLSSHQNRPRLGSGRVVSCLGRNRKSNKLAKYVHVCAVDGRCCPACVARILRRGIIMRRLHFLFSGILFLSFSIGTSAQTADLNRAATSPLAVTPGTCGGFASADSQTGSGFDLANLDRSVSPCDNFFQFAAGGWIKRNPIPPAYTRWGSFTILKDRNEDVLHAILEEASKDKNA